MPELKCPTRKKSGDWFAGASGSFCSKRFRLVDLGQWFSGEHAISEPLMPEHLPEIPGFNDGSPPPTQN